jgi:hypothetical protein
MIRLFEGQEAEGRFRGVTTLFIVGDVPYPRIEEYARSMNEVSVCKKYVQLYFGADNCSYINWFTVDKIIERKYELSNIVTVETTVGVPHEFTDDRSNLYAIINLDKTKNLRAALASVDNMKDRVQLKFDTDERSYLIPYAYVFVNNKSDIKTDVELWRAR